MTGGPDSSGTASVMRSSAVMALGTAVSRVLGFLRAALLLGVLATGPSADAFQVANTVPNALYILLAGGVLNAVLVPQITRAARMHDGGQQYIDKLLTTSIVILFGVTLIVTAGAPVLISIYGSSEWSPQTVRLAVAFALWCLPQVFWYGLYTILGQVLNARGSFGPFMWAPVVNNVVGIAGIIWFMSVAGKGPQPVGWWTPGTIGLLSATATLGVVAQALILIPAMKRAGIRFRIHWGVRGMGFRTAGRVAGWTFAAVVTQQLAFIVISQVTTTGGHLADQAGVHSIGTGYTVYTNAFLLFMLPHSLIAVSLVTALFTRMSVSAADRRMDDVRADLSLGLRLTGLATVLSVGTFLALGPDLSVALFPFNSRADTRGVAYVTMAMIIGLVPFSAQYLFQRVFYAFEDARTPFLVQVPISLTWAAGNLLSLWLLPPGLIVIGVGASMTVANILGGMLSAVLLNRRLGGLDGARVINSHVKYVVAVAIGGVVAIVISRVGHAVLGHGLVASYVVSLLGGVAIIGIYGLALKRMHATELDDALAPLLRRRRPAPRGVVDAPPADV